MSKKISRRDVVRGLGIVAAGAAATACQPKTVIVEKEVEKVVTQIVKETVKETVIVEGTPQVVEKEVTTVVEKEVTREVERAEEQVLRIMSGSSGSADFAFNCLVAGSDLQSWIPFFYVPPLYFDVDLNLQPGVFESWESNEDKTVWQFHINNQAVFSDGSPITAADVKGTWEIQINPVNDVGRIRGYLGNVVGFAEAQDTGDRADVEGIKVLDEHTVEVTLATPDPVFHWRIATCHVPAIKVQQYDMYDWDTYWLPENNPVFSGPYVLTAFDPDLKTASADPNPHWWMAEGPYLDRVVFTFVTDTQTRGAMIQNDQADCTLGDVPIQMKENYPDMFRPVKSFGFNVFWLDSKAPPTDDVNVRKALALSVDWDQVFAAAFPLRNASMTTQIIDPDLPCLDTENAWYPYDVEEAKAAIAASSYGSVEALPKLRVTPPWHVAAYGCRFGGGAGLLAGEPGHHQHRVQAAARRVGGRGPGPDQPQPRRRGHPLPGQRHLHVDVRPFRRTGGQRRAAGRVRERAHRRADRAGDDPRSRQPPALRAGPASPRDLYERVSCPDLGRATGISQRPGLRQELLPRAGRGHHRALEDQDRKVARNMQ
jgi:ABC-type transport system substrate-binding protein